ncbi:hypothetical protein TNIN_237931 [Trichonephila inaurata madagascariensis]|uniref:Uncharacterized protein n=1 Tax=Trichonephila inaurata madagascariensis TaxID=2747483 RepID=A0A8X6Y679_9ARAC|nr:hypothetical protein TNIN_237931 [Trichonephila inaurata madagascariensis]
MEIKNSSGTGENSTMQNYIWCERNDFLFSNIRFKPLRRVFVKDSEHENQSRDLNMQETLRSVSQLDIFMKSMMQNHDLSRDHIEFVSSRISQQDGPTQVREINDLIEKFETMASELCELTIKFQNAIAGMKEKVQNWKWE